MCSNFLFILRNRKVRWVHAVLCRLHSECDFSNLPLYRHPEMTNLEPLFRLGWMTVDCCVVATPENTWAVDTVSTVGTAVIWNTATKFWGHIPAGEPSKPAFVLYQKGVFWCSHFCHRGNSPPHPSFHTMCLLPSVPGKGAWVMIRATCDVLRSFKPTCRWFLLLCQVHLFPILMPLCLDLLPRAHPNSSLSINLKRKVYLLMFVRKLFMHV